MKIKKIFWSDVDQKVGSISGLIGVGMIAISIGPDTAEGVILTLLPVAAKVVSFWKEAFSFLPLF